MSRWSRWFAVGLLAAACTACSSGGGGSSPGASGVVPAQVAKARTAAEVTALLASKIPSVSLVKDYTAADDVNQLLGRPGGYTSKTAFRDSRIPADKTPGSAPDDVLVGGSVEVFGSDADAKGRMDYITQIGKRMPAAVEYDYVVGPVLVRVSRVLTPEQAQQYEAALK